MKYLIIIEPTDTGFSAYSPDIAGCIATGETQDEVRSNLIDAIEFHLEGMAAQGETIPKATSIADYVEIAA
ncbi:type II toxin-antitoxin system HicB family antitoxin [Methylomonas sp. LWB]|uniref:type II toxin-antitoxin system HicB family antitoxin n=1 Tax=unclassified Methylomonas TaxID=2608980 RepID=UPI0008DA551B|nr:type II toxin-antitoxin system HicB family antitoxin [Methylomonas sp. LWB]OHX37210.1 hypothetical protein BJL95_21325 [Methylomonas sp. LWB]